VTELVLVTRSGAEGRRLVGLVESLGFAACHASPIQLVGPADPAAVTRRLSELLPADLVILTSRQAVVRAVKRVGALALAAQPVIVPGEGTRAQAKALGLNDVIAPAAAGTSEAMLRLPELAKVAGRRIVLLAARGGRGLLKRELKRRGAVVNCVSVYRRLPARLPGDLQARINSVDGLITLIASRGALDGLFEQLGPASRRHWIESRLIVPSERIARRARSLGFQDVIVAPGAGHNAMLSALPRSPSSS